VANELNVNHYDNKRGKNEHVIMAIAST